MERDKLIACKRAQSLWRFMQVIEASRHQAERLDAIAPRIPEQLRSALSGAASQLRECANEIHAMWINDQAKAEHPDDGAMRGIPQDSAAQQFG